MAAATACTLEFAVEMSCESCVDAVRTSLQDVAGILGVEVDLMAQSVLVKTTLPSLEVQALLESTGRQAILKGMGSSPLWNLGAAVAMMGGPGPVQGVVRFLQVSPNCCLIEGTIDGLEAGPHGLHVHQYGDLTHDCASCGEHFNPTGASHGGPQDPHRHLGDLGNIYADAQGRAVFRLEDGQLKVGLRHHRPLCRPLPEPQADLQLRWADHVGGTPPACRWGGAEGAGPAPRPPLTPSSSSLKGVLAPQPAGSLG
ncbi:copper chaperone for superoxide dismutase isoform X2 [Tachyglossus aculeatus]|uniref:copper chaperone for superoxide dismutase isoform X2 n=1 Tax=Tachyglossus aculeatus TaxID=9261 RepID=UPI0018F75907|nr:copper chaperone for superoxide dismutase isoform X2 [Tachyglossus aculeatus]